MRMVRKKCPLFCWRNPARGVVQTAADIEPCRLPGRIFILSNLSKARWIPSKCRVYIIRIFEISSG